MFLQGVSSSVLVKHLKIVSHSLSELCNMGCRHLPASIDFQLAAVGQIARLCTIPVASVQRETAHCMMSLVARSENAESSAGSIDSTGRGLVLFSQLLYRSVFTVSVGLQI
jgi:hypothetical protein